MEDMERVSLTRRYRGVGWQALKRRWRAYLTVDRDMPGRKKWSQIHIGFYSNEVDAAHAYNDFARDMLGSDAQLNVLPIVTDPEPPTPEEIERICKSIREGWTEREYRRRAPHWAHVSEFVRHFKGHAVGSGG